MERSYFHFSYKSSVCLSVISLDDSGGASLFLCLYSTFVSCVVVPLFCFLKLVEVYENL